MTHSTDGMWVRVLGPLTPHLVLAELQRRHLDATRWADERWQRLSAQDPARLVGVSYDDFVALVEQEILFAVHG